MPNDLRFWLPQLFVITGSAVKIPEEGLKSADVGLKMTDVGLKIVDVA